MTRIFILAGIAAAAIGCGKTAPSIVESVAEAAPATGPRWVVVKADGLDCATCAAELKDELEQVAGVSQIETFAPSPYCRFYVEDGSLDVPALLNALPDAKSTLAGWKFVRGE
jgi:copper chaperone CopZ